MGRHSLFFVALLGVSVGISHAEEAAKPPSPEELAFFETKIRPVLVEHCYECHSADSDELGGKLQLDTREGMLTGGEAGPVLQAGKPDESLLLDALNHDGLEMPPSGPLPEQVVRDFAVWIQRGAVDPRTADAAVTKAQSGEATESDLWSLKTPKSPPVPAVTDAAWPRGMIDRYILAGIEAEKLKPAEDAKPRILARRLYYDLIGLPPTAEELQAFCEAYAREGNSAATKLVDDLLASPHFGERWGRYWLDVARYGESNGNDGLGRNPTFPHAWRYRDYVIDAFNADMPFDQFITEQLAGDLLPSDSEAEADRQIVATGFLALTAKPAKAMNNDFAMDVVADQIDVVGRGIMGISIACARCHDHKFDPIPTRDYYALAGIFTSTETMWGVAGHEKLTAPPTDLHVLKSAPHVPPPGDFVETVLVIESNSGKPKPVPESKWPPGTPLAMGVRDQKEPADCKINIKGNSKKLGAAVPRGFLSACSAELASSHPIDTTQSGRLELAAWVTDQRNPLTARVFVNRVWQHLFGKGIVRTPDDFGVYGERPTHPELLDFLAVQFMTEGWSTKQLIRNIVLSRTYQLSSEASPALLKADGENLWHAYHSRRRLDAEAIRDSMLKVSGQLNPEPADGSLIRHRDILINLAGSLHQPSNHRSVYLCYLRSSPPPELAPFNLPEFTSVTGQRETNTLPGQALHLYNSPFVIEQGKHLMQVVCRQAADPAERVRFAFRQVLARSPSAIELEQSLKLINSLTEQQLSEEEAWASYCQAMLLTNEFRYVD